MVWGGIGFHCRTPLIYIAGRLEIQLYISEELEPVVLPYIQHLPSAISQQDNARPHVIRNVQESPIRLNFFFGVFVPPIYRHSKMCGPCMHNDQPGIQHPLLYQINFGNMWNPHGLLNPKDLSKVSLILCRGV
ncbi:hypothetical protein TNCV_2619531 [Trichonephila clavipes]|uniref:Transposase n=1 Tax=Trichonephila clavipes TaxID=2585209 RepID=A0A8X6WIE2_TRICX|nr:hypothetical protein TNCV_2619531 [Trichonephila clavipes]